MEIYPAMKEKDWSQNFNEFICKLSLMDACSSSNKKINWFRFEKNKSLYLPSY